VYPLGLVRAWAYLELPGRCVVYPRPDGRLPVPADTGQDGLEGASDAAGREDFADLRAWQPGDTPRAIAWKVLARSDELVVKRFSGAAAPVWLDWQATATLRDTEARLSQLARWALDADRGGQPCGLRLPGLTLEPDTGGHWRDAALTALAEFDGA
ncbi:MAG: DUF58 domain-containing protein, partial [Gammaproteobacteria bacterium]|nr:DUF58 domain-containing protein [Gammaproteobacteria bacterium]